MMECGFLCLDEGRHSIVFSHQDIGESELVAGEIVIIEEKGEHFIVSVARR